MRAVVIKGPKQVSLEKIERWSAESGEALIRCKAAAVCTTERRFVSGDRHLYPVIGGHEFSGTIESVDWSDSELRPGDHVAIDAVRRCGHCVYCVSGNSNHCLDMTKRKERSGYVIVGGGFAEYAAAPVARVFKLPPETDFADASLIEPLSCCVHSIKKLQLAFGDTLVIIGAGTMGALHSLLGLLKGVRIVVSDIDQKRLEFAKTLGVESVVNAVADDPVEAIKDITGGRGADAVIVTAGDKHAGQQAIEMTGRLGRIVFYAAAYPAAAIELDWNRIHYQEIVITGSAGKTEADFAEALRLITGGLVNVRPLISRRISLEELPAELAAESVRDLHRVVVVH